MKIFIHLLIIGIVRVNGTATPPNDSFSTKPLSSTKENIAQLPLALVTEADPTSTMPPLSTTSVHSNNRTIFSKDNAVEKRNLNSKLDTVNIIKQGCNIKNSTCVPSKEELVASGVPNPEKMQHKIIVNPDLLMKDESSTIIVASDNVTNKPDCNVQNGTCVPTGEELVASGVSNPGMKQHQVNSLTNLMMKVESNKNIATSGTVENKPDCNVQNGSCVPTENELLASGIDTTGLRQYSIDTENVFLGQNDQNDSNVINDTVAKAIKSNEINSNQSIDRVIPSYSDTTSLKQMEEALVKASRAEITEPMKPTTAQQIPGPRKTTQQADIFAQTTASSVLETPTEVVSKIVSPKTNKQVITTDNTTDKITSTQTIETGQATKQTTDFFACPKINCTNTCVYDRMVNSDGCETCKCKFANSCPRITPVSRLLCLLRANISQSCASDADCKRNRICCPGTCGPICRRPSRTRSMLLSMLVD